MREAPALDAPTDQRFRSLNRLIGNAPLVAIDFTYRGEPRVVYAKQESLNLTGSIKDRMALFILEHAYRDGTIRPGAPMETTAPEILLQLATAGLGPDAFVAGVGTGGTVMGVGRYLKSRKPSIRVHPLEPAESPTLSTGHKVGQHRIQGISDECIPDIVNLQELDPVVAVSDGDAILVAQQLAQHGLAVGISSGANFLGALQVQNALRPDACVATVFPDSNKKYLSTDLLRTEPVKPAYLSPHIEITGFRSFQRVCAACLDFQDPPVSAIGLKSMRSV